MIYSKRHRLNGVKPIDAIATHTLPMVPSSIYRVGGGAGWAAISMDDALKRALDPSLVDLEHDRQTAKVLGLTEYDSILDYVNVDVLEQRLKDAIDGCLDDAGKEKALVTNQADPKLNGIYAMAPIDSPKGTVFKLVFSKDGIDE